MSHPTNKHERNRKARKVGKKRIEGQHFYSEEVKKRNERLHRNTTQLCSCPGCCNKRRANKGIAKLTIQERKHIGDKEWITALNKEHLD